MEKGLKNLNQAYRQAQRKHPVNRWHEDSGIGISDLDEDDRSTPIDGLVDWSASSYQHSYPTWVPSIQSILQQQPVIQGACGSDCAYSPVPPTSIVSVPPIPIVKDFAGVPKNESSDSCPSNVATRGPGPVTIANEASGYRDVRNNDEIYRPSPACEPGSQDHKATQTPSESDTNSERSEDKSSKNTETSTISESSGTQEQSSWSDSQSPEAKDPMSSHKELVLGRLMSVFYEIFNASSLGYRCRGYSDSSSAQSNEPTSTVTAAKGGPKRKLLHEDDEQNDEDTGEGSRKRPKRNEKSTKCVLAEKRGFACPYFKHNPGRYNDSRSCSGPKGWDNIHRLK